MTLKEKFELIEFSFPADESVKIADEFAIDFVKWMYDYKADINKIEELLEIYKKEKGL